MKSELIVIARTDALNARLIDSNIDPIDHPYILGKVEVFLHFITWFQGKGRIYDISRGRATLHWSIDWTHKKRVG